MFGAFTANHLPNDTYPFGLCAGLRHRCRYVSSAVVRSEVILNDLSDSVSSCVIKI